MQRSSEKSTSKINQQRPKFSQRSNGQAWRRFRRSAIRRPFEFYFTKMVSTRSEYEDGSHAAVVVDKDKYEQFIIKWLQS